VNGLNSLLDLLRDVGSTFGDADTQAVALWFLAIVFAWSGSAKIRAPALAALALVDFRLAKHARLRWGRLTGIAEVALSALLAAGVIVGPPLSVLALAAACIVLTGFTVLIGRGLLAGERFPCACFGKAETKLSAFTLVRTGALASVSGGLLAAMNAQDPAGHPREWALQLLVSAGTLALFVHAGHVMSLVKQTRSILRPPAATP
jgi:hypothetical protein